MSPYFRIRNFQCSQKNLRSAMTRLSLSLHLRAPRATPPQAFMEGSLEGFVDDVNKTDPASDLRRVHDVSHTPPDIGGSAGLKNKAALLSRRAALERVASLERMISRAPAGSIRNDLVRILATSMLDLTDPMKEKTDIVLGVWRSGPKIPTKQALAVELAVQLLLTEAQYESLFAETHCLKFQEAADYVRCSSTGDVEGLRRMLNGDS